MSLASFVVVGLGLLPAAPGARAIDPPPGPGSNLGKQRRWTFHRVAPPGDEWAAAKSFEWGRISADGSAVAVAASEGAFVLSADGKRARRLGKESARLADLSRDGGKINGYEPGKNTVRVADREGGNPKNIDEPGHVTALRMTAGGDSLLMMTSAGSVYRIKLATNEAREPKLRADAARVLQAIRGKVPKAEGGDGLNDYGRENDNLDISDDGRRIVLHCAATYGSFVMEVNGDAGDVLDVKVLAQFPKREGWVAMSALSGDGTTVGVCVQPGGEPKHALLNFYAWDGKRLATDYPDLIDLEGKSQLRMTGDGKRAAVCGGDLALFATESPPAGRPPTTLPREPSPSRRPTGASSRPRPSSTCVTWTTAGWASSTRAS